MNLLKKFFCLFLLLFLFFCNESLAYDQYVRMKVGETKTFYFPAEVTSRSSSMYSYNCSSDYINNVEVVSYTKTSVTLKALKYMAYNVHIRFDYWWQENGNNRTDTHHIHVDLNDGESDADEDANPNNYSQDMGCWGTYEVTAGNTKTLYCEFEIPYKEKLKSIVWTIYDSHGIRIIDKDDDFCKIKATFPYYDQQKVYCLMKYGNSTYQAHYNINIKATNTTLVLSPSKISLSEGESKTLKLTINPYNAQNNLHWQTTNSSIASVDNNGKVTAISPGEVTITCLDDYSNNFAKCAVTVNSVIITPTKITLPDSRTIGINEQITLTPSITPSNAQTALQWSSDNKSIATVSSSGVVKGLRAGTATITATTSNNLSAQCKITVIGNGIVFADELVKSLCVLNWDTNGDGVLSEDEAKSVTYLGNVFKEKNIESFDELQFFTGLRVIDEKAFYNCKNLKSIIIPNNVIAINKDAFANCFELGPIILPNGLTEIGERAFWCCDNLSSIQIPQNVVNIGYNAFVGCDFTSITVDNKNSHFDSRNNCNAIIETASNTLLVGCKNTIIPLGVVIIGQCAFKFNGDLTSITIPESVKCFDYDAFSGCVNLSSVNIPNSLTTIGYGAFKGCRKLPYLEIPQSVTSIGEWAFYNCVSLKSIIIPNGVSSIGEYTFSGCSSLTSVIIPESVTSIGESAFEDCSVLTSIIIPSSVTAIDEYAFKGCSGLTSVTILNGVTSIGNDAFKGCSRLTSVTIPNSVTSIGNDAFEGTSWYNEQPDGLIYAGNVAYKYKGTMPQGTEIVLKEGTVSVTESAFYGCSSLTSVTIPNSVTTIGSSAFYGTAWYNEHPDGLVYAGNVAYKYKGTMPQGTEIVLKEGTVSVTESAFSGCSGLTSITIPCSVTSIGGSAFWGCSGLTSVTILNGVTSIGSYAFLGCSGLTSVTIPNSVTAIDKYAFEDCSGLKDVFCNATDVPSTSKVAFGYNMTMESITLHVPQVSIDAYKKTSPWNEFGNIVALREEKPVIAFADENVKAICVANWDLDGDGELSEKEARAVTTLGGVFEDNTSIESFDELDFFTGLTYIGSWAFYGCRLHLMHSVAVQL